MWYNMPNTFQPDYCKEIIGYFLKLKQRDATVEGEHINKSVRETDVTFAPEGVNDNFSINLMFNVDRSIKAGNAQWFGTDLNYNESPQFGMYKSENKGFYDWHIDTLNEHASRPCNRKLSIVILLNDIEEYEGGQLELRHSDVPQNFTKAGDALLFNSGLEHRVTPVTKGTRYSLTCWAHGPNWR